MINDYGYHGRRSKGILRDQRAGSLNKSKRSEYTFCNNPWVFVCLFVCVLKPYPVCLERLEDAVTIHEPLFVCSCSSTLSWFVWSVQKSLLVCLSVFFNLILFGLERLEDRAEPIWRGLHTGSTLRPPVASKLPWTPPIYWVTALVYSSTVYLALRAAK